MSKMVSEASLTLASSLVNQGSIMGLISVFFSSLSDVCLNRGHVSI